MATTSSPGAGPDDGSLLDLFRSIAARDEIDVVRRLHASADAAVRPIGAGATRHDAATYFLGEIGHHVYRGDTALHIGAAAHQPSLAELLVAHGADVRARNRRGAEPLHYAVDGGPGATNWDPVGQAQVIGYLVGVGADPNATDQGGVAPLHRAVRNRCAMAVGALLDLGADPHLRNRSGSTPLHLAVQHTGKSNSGSQDARAEQERIIVLLLDRGARSTAADARGTTVAAAATSAWVRDLLEAHGPAGRRRHHPPTK